MGRKGTLLREPRVCCGQTWTEQYPWVVHVRQVHNAPTVCDLCGRSFVEAAACKRHRRAHDEVEANFWAKVNKDGPNGCWVWTAARVGGKSYGYFRAMGAMIVAHRFSYQLLVGPVPEGLDLDHLCRNEACVNPAHLEPVTPAENVRRGFAARHFQCPTCPLVARSAFNLARHIQFKHPEVAVA